jgi:hypothetical protein
MKKQLNLSRPHAGKLSLNKKTISNLTASEMNGKVGGASTGCTDTCQGCGHYNHTKNCTQNCTKNQNTCPGHATCYTC